MLRSPKFCFLGALAVLAACALTPAAHAAPQLDLPAKKKAKAKTLRPGSQELGKKGPGQPEKAKQADDGTILGERKTGNVANGRVGDVAKREKLYGPDGKSSFGEVTTTRQNAPGQGAARRGASLDLGKPRPKATGTEGGASVGAGSDLSLPSKEADTAAPQIPPAAPAKEEAPQPWEIAPTAARPGGAAAGGSDEAFDPLSDLASTKTAARFLFDRLQKVRRISDVETEEITDHLARLGEDGLRVARYCLSQDDDVLNYAGARTMLLSGSAKDADSVVQRLRGTVSAKSGAMILGELIEHDPVRASTPFLAEMLRHRAGAMRRVAQKELQKRLTNDDITLLVPALDHRSTDVRKAATTLLAGLDESAVVTELLFERLVDRSSSVVEVALAAVARTEAGEPDFELLRRIFASGEILRGEALMVLAVVEREDRRGSAIFTEQHVGPLLRALESPLPIVNASAAVALAGIGFRSESGEAAPWLDGPVPSSLISVATGSTFFDGFSLLRDPALRRLRLISGVNFGSNGPDWAEWWGDNRNRFQADRAVISVEPEDASRIVLRVDPGGRAGTGSYVLAGDGLSRNQEWLAAQVDPDSAQTMDVLFLSLADASDLIALLDQEGVFGSARLPGPRGSFGRGGRSIEVELGKRSKSFGFSTVQSQSWFDRILERAQGLAAKNAWQLYPIEGVHADSTDLYRREASWWAEPRTPEEENQRFLELLIDHLQAAPLMDRDRGSEEVARLVAEMDGRAGASGAALYPEGALVEMLGLLEQEEVLGARARRLTQAVSGMIERSGADPLRDRLLATLHDRFGPLALSSIGEILQGAGRGPVLAAAVDERPLMRTAAALNLGQGSHPDDVDLLVGLLSDDEADVEIAAIAGLAQRKAEGARASIWMRARASVPSARSTQTRAAALRAVGMIGGTGALELLVAGLTDTDERFHLPAAEGLAALGTPETAALLVSLLRGTKRPSIEAVAKEGILRLGEVAHDDLFAAMRSPDRQLQRDAAVLLAQQLEPRAVPVLTSTLALDQDDTAVADELAILTCVDYSDEAMPADRYFQWWDEVEHDSSYAWFAAALEQRGLRAPEAEAFTGQGTDDARLFLLTLIRELDGFMGERALRELERLHGERLGPVPLRVAERDAWFRSVRGKILPGEASAAEGAPSGRDD